MPLLIKSLHLKNIKSYVDARIEFKEGINGILGENGHGKTTILEAIGYCLFDYLPINKKDFVRKGQKSGEVSLAFELDDGLEYEIRKGVEKPLYKITLGSGKELKTRQDCEDWLLDTIFPDTGSMSNVGDLFSNMIGVPQGQFTTAFLQTPANRKTTFDGILRLDQYEEVWGGLKVVNTAVDKEVEGVEKTIMYLRGQAEGVDSNKDKFKELTGRLEGVVSEIDKAAKDLDLTQAEANRQEALEKQFDILNREIASLEKRGQRSPGSWKLRRRT